MKNIKNVLRRFKSVPTILAMVAQICAILVVFKIITPTESDTLNVTIAGVCELLTMFGVLNNPTDKKNF